MAHLKLAMCVDSRSTQCAEALGKLYLRTPAFVLEYGLADFESRKAHAYLENDRALLGDLLPLPFDEELDENISDKFRIIDDLVVEAGHQVTCLQLRPVAMTHTVDGFMVWSRRGSLHSWS